jgi:hypothetical protein
MAGFLVEGSSPLLMRNNRFPDQCWLSSWQRTRNAQLACLDAESFAYSSNRDVSYPPQSWYHMNPNAGCSRRTA